MNKKCKLLIGIIVLGVTAFTGCNKAPIKDNTNYAIEAPPLTTESAINQNRATSETKATSKTTGANTPSLKSFAIYTIAKDKPIERHDLNVDESIHHVNKKIQGQDFTVYYESREAQELNQTLGTNIEEEIYKTEDGYYHTGKILIMKPVYTSITSSNNEDILVNACFPGEDGRSDLAPEAFMVYTKEQGKYVKAFAEVFHGGKQFDSRYEFLDIDSDGKNEIYYDFYWSAMGRESEDCMILKYQNGKMNKIFAESMSQFNKSNPISYNNSLNFVQSTTNKNLYDISFKVNFKFDKDMYESGRSLKIPLEKQSDRSETYIFKFNGEKYVPTRPLIDYRNY